MEQVDIPLHLLDSEANEEVQRDIVIERDRLKKKRRDARTNVILSIALSILMFGLAFVPMSNPTPWEDITLNADAVDGVRPIFKAEGTRHLDNGTIYGNLPLIVGWPVEGEDFTDVEVRFTVDISTVSSKKDFRLGIYPADDNGGCHNHHRAVVDYQYGNATSGADELLFFVDPGSWCFIAEHTSYLQTSDRGVARLSLEIDTWPMRNITPPIGLIFILLAMLSIRGARKKDTALRALDIPAYQGTEAELEILSALAEQDKAAAVITTHDPYAAAAALPTEAPQSMLMPGMQMQDQAAQPAQATQPVQAAQQVQAAQPAQATQPVQAAQPVEVATQPDIENDPYRVPGWRWDQDAQQWVPDPTTAPK